MSNVLMAMSGGVDSAVSTYLLLQQGYSVTGLTLRLCGDEQAIKNAQALAKHLQIEHIALDWREYFENKVVSTFKNQYFSGLTPNPCIICNQNIKFGALLDYAIANGYDYLATGHYARKVNFKGELCLARALTDRRDQSYYLYHLSNCQLEKIIFPLGEFKNKEEVLRVYEKIGFVAPAPAESRGICFTSGAYYGDWLALDPLAMGKGKVLDRDGNYRGEHNGFYRYTIGQKRLAAVDMSSFECVLDLDEERNLVIVGAEELCYSKRIVLDQVRYHESVRVGQRFTFKIFTWGLDLLGEIKSISDQIEVEFVEPVRAVALGQYAAAYLDDMLLLGGRIIAKA